MATSTAALLSPEEVDDKAPPIDCRTRERMSQGYGKIPGSVLPRQRYKLGLKTRPQSENSRSMSLDSRFGSNRKKEQRRHIR